MIQIYKRDNTNYEQNGDSVLVPVDCNIEAKLNGSWELQMEHPLDSEGKFEYIETGAVIAAPSFMSGKQLFRIYNTERTDSYIMAYARPIFLDAQEDCFLIDKRPTDKDGQGALDMLMEGSKYSGTSNITDIHTAYYIRKNLIEALAGNAANSFLNLWGGETLFDNYRIIINEQVGADHGMKATFGRNIVGITENVNMDGVITRIIPVAFNGYMLEGDEPWVDSPLIDNYTHPYIQEVKFKNVKLQSDCDEGEEGFADLASLREELIRQCNLMYENGYDKPSCNYSISLVDLSQTEEYKDYVELETISLGDFIECEYEPLGIATKARVIQLTYDCIRKCNSAVELGDFTYDYFAETSKKTAQINSVIDDNGNLIAERVQGVLDALTTQLRYQKTVAQKQDVRAILFEDTDPNSELYGALSIGTQGFQIANKMLEDGSDWDWSTAFTANGGYADAIVAGILTDKLGKTYWNLDTGELVLSGGTDIGGMSVEEIVEAAEAASKAENAVASVNVAYALSDSTTTAPTSGWSNKAPEWTEGKYMWQKTVTVYVNGTIEESTATCISGATGQPGADGKDGAKGEKGDTGAQGIQGIQGEKGEPGEQGIQGEKGDTGAKGEQGAQGEKGEKGDKGDTGATGVGVKAIVEQYYLSSSSTTQTGGSWSTTSPTWKSGYYIWTRSKLTWTNGTTSYTTPVLANALNEVSQNAANAAATISDWCYNNDTTYINGAKVYAPKLFSKAITVTGTGWVYPTQEDVDLVKSLMSGSPTAAQIALYDFNGDGKITITDFTACKGLVLGTKSIDDYPNYTKQMSTITVTIDASKPDKIIRMTGTSSFGRTFDYCFGLNGLKANSVVCEGVTAGAVETTGGVNLDDFYNNAVKVSNYSKVETDTGAGVGTLLGVYNNVRLLYVIDKSNPLYFWFGIYGFIPQQTYVFQTIASNGLSAVAANAYGTIVLDGGSGEYTYCNLIPLNVC